MKKIILCQIYDQEPCSTSLIYEQEIRRFKILIEALMVKCPKLSIDQAYLAIKNYYSSVNTYSIKEIDKSLS